MTGLRRIVVEHRTFRWRFDGQIVVIPEARSSPQLVVAWGWEDWLEPNSTPAEPQVVTPRFVAAAIRFALAKGWNPGTSGPRFRIAFDQGEFQVSELSGRGGYTVLPSALIDYPPSALLDFVVYGVEWIDNLHFILPAERFVEASHEYVETARVLFLAAGWDGDGEIGLLWLPDFVFPVNDSPGTNGMLLWHVKQEEDGTSYLLSPRLLPFETFAGRKL